MARQHRTSITFLTLACDWCGKSFTCMRRDARFCSSACRQQHHKNPGILAGPRPVTHRRPRFDAFTFIG